MKAKSLAQKILSFKNKEETKVAEVMRQSLIKVVAELANHCITKPLEGGNNITDEELETIAALKQLPSEEYSHGEIVVSHIEDIGNFIRMWRKRFLDNLNPKFLPKGWSVNHRIEGSFIKPGK
eukprot:TRINITY_DN7492_c0_g1_i11.p2 TRINITY_DN7492_c0_g1~~TRINITY_DN7492_c0_g1_i11.p2  ORF type:complete len:123 (+),score=17.33 TRINITY_DN7492_c0_g1_i11:95-463(+)